MLRLRRPGDLPECVAALAEVHREDGYPTRWPAQPAAWLSPAGHTQWNIGPVSAYDLTCRSAYDVMCRSNGVSRSLLF